MFGVTPPSSHRERSPPVQSRCVNYCGKFSSIEYGLNWDCISCFGAAATNRGLSIRRATFSGPRHCQGRFVYFDCVRFCTAPKLRVSNFKTGLLNTLSTISQSNRRSLFATMASHYLSEVSNLGVSEYVAALQSMFASVWAERRGVNV